MGLTKHQAFKTSNMPGISRRLAQRRNFHRCRRLPTGKR